jgi:PAS domain S-box-containing protein
MVLDDLSARTLLDALPQPALVIDSEGVIVDGNAAAAVLLGAASLPRGRNILRYLPEEERARLNPLAWLRRWAEHPDAPELQHVRLLCRDEQGIEKPLRVRTGVLPTGARSYLLLLDDVSAEDARAQRTRAAHRLAARVLAISADGIINVDQDLIIRYANASAETLFDYPPGALLGQPLAVLLPERFRDGHVASMRRFAAEPSPARLMGQRGEIRGVTRTGEEVPLEASITKVTVDQHQVFSAHLRDLRPRRAVQTALARSEARFRTAFDHAQQAMALLSPDGRVVEMNPAARRLLPEWVEPIGQPFSVLPFWSGDPAGTAAELERAVAGCLAGHPYRSAGRVKRADGTEQALDLSLSPVRADSGTFAIIAEARLLGPRTS